MFKLHKTPFSTFLLFLLLYYVKKEKVSSFTIFLLFLIKTNKAAYFEAALFVIDKRRLSLRVQQPLFQLLQILLRVQLD